LADGQNLITFNCNLLKMYLKGYINSRANEFTTLCQSHNVTSLYAFGSSVKGDFNLKSSDIDLLIEIDEDDPIEKGSKLINIWDKLEAFFERKVDLLTFGSIKNPILRQNIDASKVLIYDGRNQKVSV